MRHNVSNIIIPGEAEHNKDCADWCPLKDGTRTGDPKYCNLSLQCKQLGMYTQWYEFTTAAGEASFDYFCTGMYVNEETKKDDNEVS